MRFWKGEPDPCFVFCFVAVACEVFIVLNDARLKADDLALYPVYLALAEGSLPEAEFAAWLRTHLQLDAGKDVHEERARYAR